jgi:hypothetical protein
MIYDELQSLLERLESRELRRIREIRRMGAHEVDVGGPPPRFEPLSQSRGRVAHIRYRVPARDALDTTRSRPGPSFVAC